MKTSKHHSERTIDYFIVFLMILCSGTVVFNIKYNSIFIPFFCLTSCIGSAHNNKINFRSMENALIIFGIVVLNFFIHIMDGVAFNGVIQISLYVVGTFFATRAMNFASFKKIFTEITVVLTIVAMIVFGGVNLGIIGAHVECINGSYYQMSLWHVVGWGATIFNTRMCGLFHEPGMYQVILNIALLCAVDDVLSNSFTLKKILQIVFLIVAIITTRSTAGYIVMCLVLGILYFRARRLMKKGYQKLLYYSCVPIVLFIGYKIMMSEVVTTKLSTANISFSIRYNDLLSGILMMLKKPFVGYGYNSQLYEAVSLRYGMDGTSNGLIGVAMMFGIPTLLIFVWLLVYNIKRTAWKIPLVLLLIFILMEEMTESCFFFPAMLFFFFRFRSDLKCIKNG